MIAETLGNNCEVVIHDLTMPQTSVVYVANNSVTHRKKGDSFEHLIRQVLLNKNFKNDYTANYQFQWDDKTVKSSSALIRNKKGDVIGMICINIDVSSIDSAIKVLNDLSFINNGKENAEESGKDEIDEVNMIVNKLIDDIIGKKFNPNQNKAKNLEIIRFMDQKGIFLVKGAIDRVAQKMNLSKVTIYSYINEIQNEKNDLL